LDTYRAHFERGDGSHTTLHWSAESHKQAHAFAKHYSDRRTGWKLRGVEKVEAGT
jgi:hypothetical protein